MKRTRNGGRRRESRRGGRIAGLDGVGEIRPVRERIPTLALAVQLVAQEDAGRALREQVTIIGSSDGT